MINQKETYLEIKATDIPCDKYFTFNNTIYLFKFKLNQSGRFTVEIYNQKGTEFLFSNVITYGQPLMDSKLAPFQDKIIPLNISKLLGESSLDVVDSDSLGNEIKLYTDITEE